MDEYQEKILLYIQRSVQNVCPYEEKDLQVAYQLGFMQGVMVRMILMDNKNLSLFKKIIEENKNG
jgi:hypothetical protein